MCASFNFEESVAEDLMKELMNDDIAMIKLANQSREKLFDSPAQSEFRVYAILIVKDVSQTLQLVHGSNCEQGFIGGAICAERAAICRLRFINKPVIVQVTVVSDSDNPLSPGALCREFLMSHAQPQVKVLMGNRTGDKISVTTLGAIWPFPYLYRYKRRSELLDFAKEQAAALAVNKLTVTAAATNTTLAAMLAASTTATTTVATTTTTADDISEFSRLYRVALSANNKDSTDKIHPIRLSAAVLFDDGSISRAWQLKGLEYGCTLDPVTQLLHGMHSKSHDYLCCSCCSGNVPAVVPVGSTTKNSTSDDNAKAAALAAATNTASIMCDYCSNDNNNSKEPSVGEKRKLITAVVKPVKPRMLVMVDHFGVAHAPFAQARALLSEHGMSDVLVLLHSEHSSIGSNSNGSSSSNGSSIGGSGSNNGSNNNGNSYSDDRVGGGKLIAVRAGELLPHPPDCPLLSHDDFH